MGILRTQLLKLSQTHYGKIFLALILFLAFSLVSLFIFYNGFLINFKLINNFVFKPSTPGFLNFVPYNFSSISLGALCHPYFLMGLLVLYFPILFFRKSFFSKEFIYSKSEKLLVFTAAFLLTWELVTYNYNYYLDSAFYIDRFLLILLTVLLLRFPLLTPLYIALAFVYRSQFNYPVAGFELFDKRLLFDILILFVSYRYIKAFVSDFKISFVWLVLCIVASNYFYSGIAKVRMSPHGYEWVTQNNLADLFLNVHLRGWMSGVSEVSITSIWNFLNDWHVPFQFLVLATELSALFLLRSKKLAIIILSISFMMHLCIFYCGSMLFWKWMAIDALLVYIIIKDKSIAEELKQKKTFIVSVIIIFSAVIWLRPFMIGWYDTPVNQYFTYEVQDEKGVTYELEKNEMNPYHQWFQYDHFLFLVDKPCLPITGFGYTNKHKLFKELKSSGPDELLKLELSEGVNHFDSLKTASYYSFIKTYFTNRNKLLDRNLVFTAFRAPYHLHNSATGLVYKNQAPVSKFKIIYNLSLSSSAKTAHLYKTTIHEISIAE